MNKPRISIVLILIAVMMIFTSCGNNDDDYDLNENNLDLNVSECADKLKENIPFEDTITAIDDKMGISIYQLNAEDVAEQKVYVSTGATAEQIAVFEATDNNAAKRIETAIMQRIADQIESYQDYMPEEVPKLSDPFIKVIGKYVILCISDHNEDVEVVLDKYYGI
mgnify:CR=1 FL=1|jgi:hypothetical protein